MLAKSSTCVGDFKERAPGAAIGREIGCILGAFFVFLFCVLLMIIVIVAGFCWLEKSVYFQPLSLHFEGLHHISGRRRKKVILPAFLTDMRLGVTGNAVLAFSNFFAE